jgi:protein involved in polysaccharide export with SLBB domain
VLEAIITAGGFTDFANRRKVQLVRAKDGSTVTLDCNKARGNPELDLPVNPGDKIIVPRNVF